MLLAPINSVVNERNAKELEALKADARAISEQQREERRELTALEREVERESARLAKEAGRRKTLAIEEDTLRAKLMALEAKRLGKSQKGMGGLNLGANGQLNLPDLERLPEMLPGAAAEVLESAAVGLIKFFVPEEVYKTPQLPQAVETVEDEDEGEAYPEA